MPLSFSTIGSFHWRPIRRLMAKKVLVGLVTAWRFAGWPTTRSPSSMKATTDGVVRAPSAFSITFGCLPSMMATHELVVPRSMPMILLINLRARSLLADAAVKPSQAKRFGVASSPVRSAAGGSYDRTPASPADMGEIAGPARAKAPNPDKGIPLTPLAADPQTPGEACGSWPSAALTLRQSPRQDRALKNRQNASGDAPWSLSLEPKAP